MDYNTAMDKVLAHSDVRRAPWPEGRFLKFYSPDVWLIRRGDTSLPWVPTPEDRAATDWQMRVYDFTNDQSYWTGSK